MIARLVEWRTLERALVEACESLGEGVFQEGGDWSIDIFPNDMPPQPPPEAGDAEPEPYRINLTSIAKRMAERL